MKLRDYQKAMDAKLWELRGKRVLQQLPTGTGKGVLITKNVWDMIKLDLSILIVVPSGLLVEDLYERITDSKPYLKKYVSRLGTRKENFFNKISIGVYKSIYNRLKIIPEYDVVITDEVQHARCNTFETILNRFSNAWHIGYTATPERSDGKPLGQYYDYINSYASLGWFIDKGYLSPYTLYSWETNYQSKTSRDDLVEQDTVFNKGDLIADSVKEWEEKALGLKTIVYATTTEHCHRICEKFNNYFQGKYRFEYIGSKQSLKVREKTLELYLKGEITGLVNVNLFIEGVDIPDVACLSLQRFVGSPGMLTQIWGRGLRYKKDKNLIILDHAGNAHVHGSPRFEREYSLFPELNLKTPPEKLCCSHCNIPLVFKNVVTMAAEKGYSKICPECGTLNEWLIIPEPKPPRKPKEEQDGKLVKYVDELDDWHYIRRVMESTNMLHQKKVKRIVEHTKISIGTKIKALKILEIDPRTIAMYLGL